MSPAQTAGLAKNQAIFAVAGEEVTSRSDALNKLKQAQGPVAIIVSREVPVARGPRGTRRFVSSLRHARLAGPPAPAGDAARRLLGDRKVLRHVGLDAGLLRLPAVFGARLVPAVRLR